MLPRPLLELDHPAISSSRRCLRLALHDTALCEELDKAPYPHQVFLGDALGAVRARAPTAMFPKAIDACIIDLGDRDLGPREPLSEMASGVTVVVRRTARMTQPR